MLQSYSLNAAKSMTGFLLDDGAYGEGAAGDSIYGATIAANVSTNGQMVRYYVTAAAKLLALVSRTNSAS
jgi:hypothetical protein